MKAKPVRLEGTKGNMEYVQCEVELATHVVLKVPVEFEPLQNRIIPIILKGSRDKHDGMVWSWNGDTEKPTIKPSILSRITWGEKQIEHRCHTWITDGKAQFLSDCTHDKVNQTIELNEVE